MSQQSKTAPSPFTIFSTEQVLLLRLWIVTHLYSVLSLKSMDELQKVQEPAKVITKCGVIQCFSQERIYTFHQILKRVQDSPKGLRTATTKLYAEKQGVR